MEPTTSQRKSTRQNLAPATQPTVEDGGVMEEVQQVMEDIEQGRLLEEVQEAPAEDPLPGPPGASSMTSIEAMLRQIMVD